MMMGTGSGKVLAIWLTFYVPLSIIKKVHRIEPRLTRVLLFTGALEVLAR